MEADNTPSLPSRRQRAGSALLGVVVGVSWFAALALRVRLGRNLPLWIDETWTGMIAGQPGWHGFWREAWLDVNPPFYYALMALWTSLAGLSDMALRVPSMVFVAVAAALPLILRPAGLSLSARLCWSALLILWVSGIEISLDARGYGLLLLLSVALLIALARALERPSANSLFLWATLAAAAVLTHYFALLPAALQGFALLIRLRGKVRPYLSSALPFAVAFGWLAVHAPRLADYARPDIAWYEPVTAKLASGFVQYLAGPPGWLHWGLIGGALIATILLSKGRFAPAANGRGAWEAAALCGVVAGLALLGLALIKPTLTARYLVPVVPSVLLALVLIAARFRASTAGHVLLLLVFLVPLAAPEVLQARLAQRNMYGFEKASAFLAPYRPQQLTFVWDHPASRILDRGSLSQLGSFFLRRDGETPLTQAFVLQPGADGNRLLPRVAQGGAVIWIYNRARNSAARRHPPRAALWTGWTCQHERARWVGILTCVQVAKPPDPIKVAP